MNNPLKTITYVFGFLSVLYSFLYIREFGFGYFVQLTTGMGMMQGAFLVSLLIFLLRKQFADSVKNSNAVDSVQKEKKE